MDALLGLSPAEMDALDEDILVAIFANIDLCPEVEEFSPVQWHFIRHFTPWTALTGLVHRIPGGRAELERAAWYQKRRRDSGA